MPQPSQGIPGHVRYEGLAAAPDIGQLTRGTRGSKRARRVAEDKAQATHSLAGISDLNRTEPIGDRDKKLTGAGRDSSLGGTCLPAAS